VLSVSRTGLVAPPLARSAAVAACVALLGAGAAGCSTTQEKAEKQQARATHILRERAKREAKNKQEKARGKHHHGKLKGGKDEGGKAG
jgi:hypothetical protein